MTGLFRIFIGWNIHDGPPRVASGSSGQSYLHELSKHWSLGLCLVRDELSHPLLFWNTCVLFAFTRGSQNRPSPSWFVDKWVDVVVPYECILPITLSIRSGIVRLRFPLARLLRLPLVRCILIKGRRYYSICGRLIPRAGVWRREAWTAFLIAPLRYSAKTGHSNITWSSRAPLSAHSVVFASPTLCRYVPKHSCSVRISVAMKDMASGPWTSHWTQRSSTAPTKGRLSVRLRLATVSRCLAHLSANLLRYAGILCRCRACCFTRHGMEWYALEMSKDSSRTNILHDIVGHAKLITLLIASMVEWPVLYSYLLLENFVTTLLSWA